MGRHGGPWGPPPSWGRGWHGGGHPMGPPPWLAGLFGTGQTGGAPKVRRGDVRSAILDVLRAAHEADEPINGYQVIQRIGERSNGAWRPSPGSVYPTIQQLQDEGLVENDDERGRRTVRLTEEGRTYCDERLDDLAAVWAPFEEAAQSERGRGAFDLTPEIGQVMSAIWQITTTGSRQQREAAIEILADTRRRLYGLLADGDDAENGTGVGT